MYTHSDIHTYITSIFLISIDAQPVHLARSHLILVDRHGAGAFHEIRRGYMYPRLFGTQVESTGLGSIPGRRQRDIGHATQCGVWLRVDPGAASRSHAPSDHGLL